VARRNGVVGIVRRLRAAEDVLPPGADLGAGGDGDDARAHGAGEAQVAGHLRRIDVLHGVVALRRAHADELPLVDAVDGDALEDRVRRGRGGCESGEGEGELHGGMVLADGAVKIGRDEKRERERVVKGAQRGTEVAV